MCIRVVFVNIGVNIVYVFHVIVTISCNELYFIKGNSCENITFEANITNNFALRKQDTLSFVKCTLILLMDVNILLTESGSETTGGEQLNMEQMAGIFIVFAIGIGLGLICMVFEYLCAASTDTFKDNIEGVRIKNHRRLLVLPS